LQAELGVDFLFGLGGQGLGLFFVRDANRPYSLMVYPIFWARFAQFDVVLLGTGEILQGRAESRKIDDAEIALNVVRDNTVDFVSPAPGFV